MIRVQLHNNFVALTWRNDVTMINCNQCAPDNSTPCAISVALIDKGVYKGAYCRKQVSYPSLEVEDLPQTALTTGCHANQCGTLIHRYCPGSRLVSIDVFGQEVYAKPEMIAAAIQWASANAFWIICIELATIFQRDVDILQSACYAAFQEGSLLIAPVENISGQGYPAVFDTVVGVIAGDVRGSDGFARLGRNGVDLVCDGAWDCNGEVETKQDFRAYSSYAVARCAGMITNLWSKSPDATRSDILSQIKRLKRRQEITSIYMGRRKFDLGGWQHSLKLRQKPLLNDRPKLALGKRIVRIGKGGVCAGMSSAYEMIQVEPEHLALYGRGSKSCRATEIWESSDAVFIDSHCTRQQVRRVIWAATEKKSMTVITEKSMIRRFRCDIDRAIEAGCHIYTGPCVEEAPRWYLREHVGKMGTPCIVLIAMCSHGRLIDECRSTVNDIVAGKNGHRVMWGIDVSDGWLAGFDLCVPAAEIASSTHLPLDCIISIIQHEICRRSIVARANLAVIVITTPLLSTDYGSFAISPWAAALLAACMPCGALLLVNNSIPEWFEASCIKVLLGQFSALQLGVVYDDHIERRHRYGVQSMSSPNTQTENVRKFSVSEAHDWQAYYEECMGIHAEM